MGGEPLLALFEKACPEREPKGPSNAYIVRPRFARQVRVRPVPALSTTDFSSHSTVTAVIDVPIAIPENEDRIGSARSMRLIEPQRTTSTLSLLFCR